MLIANLLSIAITAALVAACYMGRKKLLADFDIFIRRAALVVFLAGFAIYFIGFRSGHEAVGTQMSWYASFFRPLLSSMEMFAFHSDLIEVGEPCHHSMVYMTLFSVIHFAAASVSFAVAINYLGVRFRSAWRWRRVNRARQLRGNVHVFFGINNVSLRLAHDIRSHSRTDTIIFINAPEDASSHGLLGFASIFNVFSFRREVIADIDRMRGIIRQTRMPVQMRHGNNVIKQLRLDRVLSKANGFIGLYLLYDDELQNLSKNIKLRADRFFKGDMARKAYIFCRATTGKLNGGTAFEYNSRYGVETVLVDAAQLAVKSMMFRKETHPANFIEFDTHTGIATTAFHCMIIGFGETGQEAFRFLYEHGQFVYPEGYEGKRVVFHIIDPYAEQKKGFFETRYPCLGNEGSMSPLHAEIRWHNHSAGDGRFWTLMKEIKDELNYVVIATGSDNRNIAIAYDLGEFALRWRQRRLSKFGIVTRCYDAINEPRYDELTELCVDEEHRQQVVHVIGKMTETFTHKYVWKDYLESDAAIYAATFAENVGRPFADIRVVPRNEALCHWWKRHASAKGDAIKYANIRRIEVQEFSEASHLYAKLKAIGVLDADTDATGAENLRLLRSCRTLADMERLPFFGTLMQMEHTRCLASHECMGYTPMSLEEFRQSGGNSECDVIRHKSLNLVPWEQLDSMPAPTWLAAIVPEPYKRCPNRYLLANMLQTILAIGLNKTAKKNLEVRS